MSVRLLPHAPRRVAGLALVAGFLSLPAACGGAAEGPSWTRLAARSDVGLHREEDVAFETADGRSVVLVREDDDAVWMETTLTREDWTPTTGGRNGWVAKIPIRGIERPAEGPPERLRTEERVFRRLVKRDAYDPQGIPTGSFFTAFGMIQILLEEDEEPPREARLRSFALHHTSDAGEHRVAGRRFSGDGFALAPGERATMDVDVREPSSLHFATCVESALAENTGEVVFRVRLDGTPVFEHRMPVLADGAADWHELPVPAPGGELSFEVEGSFAFASFLAPTVGPSAVGGFGERPWGHGRPDIVVFLADTLRTDSLSCYGNPLPLTPNIDRMAREGLRFERAWSPSTWTLPAHASLFTGVRPHRTTAVEVDATLPRRLTTIAEVLRRRGYRTGAVTEAVFVSQRHGLDQGFEWFEEHPAPLEATVAAADAFFDADDGRPTFLFVQTYQTHSPYEVSDETRARLGETLGLDFEESFDEMYETWNRCEPVADDLREDPVAGKLIRNLQAMYEGGVVDLDRGFGSFYAALESHGLLEHGYLVFTSDHGEAFGEHNEIFHSGSVYEELLSIPLLIRGPGIRPGVVPHNVSLVDVAPTLGALANVPAEDVWTGTSLLRIDGDRPVFAYQCATIGESGFAIREGDRKVILFDEAEAIEDRELFAAFDLHRDPEEQEDVLGTDARWPTALLERTAEEALLSLEPLAEPRSVPLDHGRRKRLEALGYGGSE